MALNSFSVTQFTSETLGTFLIQQSPFMNLSYRGVQEYEKFSTNQRGYKLGDTVNIKIPGYPTSQRGVAVTPEAVVDRVVPYTISDNDIYNTSFELDIRESVMKVSGGILAFTEDPNRSGNGDKDLNPQAKTYIDNYVVPSGLVIKGDMEVTLAGKCASAAFYTPIDRVSKLKPINSYSDISGVDELMNELGFMSNRYAIMNNADARGVADSLQNMFNQAINKEITLKARIGGANGGELAGFDLFKSNSIQNVADSAQYLANPTSTGVTISAVAVDGSTITFAGFDPALTPAVTAGTLIAIPTVNLINKVNKKVIETTLVVCAAADADSDGGGLCTVTLSEPLQVTGFHQNVDSFPGIGAAAEVFPGHRNNYFFVPMGIIANPIALDEIHGADNSRFAMQGANVDVRTYVQGVVNNGVNSIRMSSLVPTLAIPSYLINLISPIA